MNKKHFCPVCGKTEFPDVNSFDICKICNWEDDADQEENPDEQDGANHMSLNEAREAYKKGVRVW